jgi:hypothetical protein
MSLGRAAASGTSLPAVTPREALASLASKGVDLPSMGTNSQVIAASGSGSNLGFLGGAAFGVVTVPWNTQPRDHRPRAGQRLLRLDPH